MQTMFVLNLFKLLMVFDVTIKLNVWLEGKCIDFIVILIFNYFFHSIMTREIYIITHVTKSLTFELIIVRSIMNDKVDISLLCGLIQYPTFLYPTRIMTNESILLPRNKKYNI